MAKTKRYNKEFKMQAAELVTRQGFSQAEAARRLGVSSNSIADWIKALRASGDLPKTGESSKKPTNAVSYESESGNWSWRTKY